MFYLRNQDPRRSQSLGSFRVYPGESPILDDYSIKPVFNQDIIIAYVILTHAMKVNVDTVCRVMGATGVGKSSVWQLPILLWP